MSNSNYTLKFNTKQSLNHCKNCHKEYLIQKGSLGVFCCLPCQAQWRKKSTRARFVLGSVTDRGTIRKILHEQNPSCFECGIQTWQGKTISLEVDHIDGDASNNLPNNLRLLCPNCHSVTPTWKARNKGSGRASRGLKLY
jgi:5-methylcytosine-specific restriction endonuclease McrA